MTFLGVATGVILDLNLPKTFSLLCCRIGCHGHQRAKLFAV